LQITNSIQEDVQYIPQVIIIPKAEDIMQESFLTAFEEISGYHETLSFSDWLQKFLVKRLVAEISSVNY
jgi:DNA-directed RNA polymerase specialized sigma24 family protein